MTAPTSEFNFLTGYTCIAEPNVALYMSSEPVKSAALRGNLVFSFRISLRVQGPFKTHRISHTCVKQGLAIMYH